MFAGGSVLGLAIGGTIVQLYGWRLTFFSIIPIAIFLIIIIIRSIPSEKKAIDISKVRNEDSYKKFDFRGAILLGMSITSFLLFITFLRTNTFDTNYNLLE